MPGVSQTAKRLDKGLGRFDCALHSIGGLFESALHWPARAFDRLFRLFTETLCLLLEIVCGVFEVVACVLDSLTELLARPDSCLWSVEESDRGSRSDADAEREPV